MLRAVIFDVDGVMLDSEPLFAQGRRSICAKYGLTEPTGKNLNGSGMRAFWSSVLAENGNKTLDADELSRENFDHVLDAVVENGLTETAGLTELLRFLRGKYALAVGSSSDGYYVESVLDRLGIAKYFDVTVCGDEVARAKPFGDIYLKALELLKLDADECCVIEDSDNGVKAAVSAGIPCIGVSLVDPPTQSLSGCAVKFGSLAQVKKFFEGLE